MLSLEVLLLQPAWLALGNKWRGTTLLSASETPQPLLTLLLVPLSVALSPIPVMRPPVLP